MKPARIVVPLDGTDLSERAIPVARALAERSGGSLRLVRVHIPPRIPATSQRVLGPRVGKQVRRDRAEARRRDERYLERASGEADALPEVSTALLRGPAGHSVLDEVRRSKATLVVLSAPVPELDEGDPLDSVTDTVVRGCPTPILVVRGESVPTAQEPFRLRHVLIPLDGSPRSMAVLEPAADLASLFGASATLIRVMQKEGPAEQEAAGQDLESAAEVLRGRAVETDTLLEPGDPAQVIVETAQARNSDLIAMASRCRGPLTRLVLGSVSNRVLRRVQASVLVSPTP